MRTLLRLMIPFLSSLSGLEAQPVFVSKSGEVSFFSEAPLENIDAHNRAPNSFLNISTNELAFIIPISNFEFKKSLMREHFNEKYMESDKFPMATFKGRINETVDFTKNGKHEVSATGTLSIHGVDKTITEKGSISIQDQEISLTSNFFVAIENYNITKPKLLYQNIADTILVKLNLLYIPYKKKP